MTLSEFYCLNARRIDGQEEYDAVYGSRKDEFDYVDYLFAPYSDIHLYRNKQTGEYVYTEFYIGD